MIAIETLKSAAVKFDLDRLEQIEKRIDASITFGASDGRFSGSISIDDPTNGIRKLIKEVLIPKYEAAGYKMELDYVQGYHCNLFAWAKLDEV